MLIVEANPPRLLLDTHVWIWLVEGVAARLSARCISALRQASRDSRIWVSAISVWEVALLESRSRITLSEECPEWVARALSRPGVHFAGLEPSIAIESTRLPEPLHGDPADRILVATARHLDATLVTSDREILSYGSRGHVNVMDAGS
jgi:PIN domain nuclease of toxin-antitoxin system